MEYQSSIRYEIQNRGYKSIADHLKNKEISTIKSTSELITMDEAIVQSINQYKSG